jgi:hypothetical protein
MITRTVSMAKCISDLIVYLRNTRSQGIKKQGDFGRHFCQKCNLWAGIKSDRDLQYKINNK